MKFYKRYILILLIFASSATMFAQGFNWQYSARMPSSYPHLFLGASVSYSFLYEIADFRFTEEFIPCCSFDNGTGSGFHLGGTGEYWLPDGQSAITAEISYSRTLSQFTTQREWITVNYPVRYEFIYESILDYAHVEALYKKRLKKSHFSLSAGIALDVLVYQDNEYKEQIISPDEEVFSDGSRERIIANGQTAPISGLTISPVLAAGYDLNMGKSRYGNIGLFGQIPIMKIINDDSWHRFEVGLKIKVYFGLK